MFIGRVAATSHPSPSHLTPPHLTPHPISPHPISPHHTPPHPISLHHTQDPTSPHPNPTTTRFIKHMNQQSINLSYVHYTSSMSYIIVLCQIINYLFWGNKQKKRKKKKNIMVLFYCCAHNYVYIMCPNKQQKQYFYQHDTMQTCLIFIYNQDISSIICEWWIWNQNRET